jgi:patatin-like phospholipase/acyl hydrolase
MDPIVPILAIDGGGIRGLLPALVLEEIERRTSRPIAELFRLIAGTSTGGLIALGLTVPGEAGRPKFAASDLASLYLDHGATIFPRNPLREVAATLAGPKFPVGGLEEVLRGHFAETMLSEAIVEVLVPSYEIERDDPYLFRRTDARRDRAADFPMWQVARATSAAPTFFKPMRIDRADPTLPYLALIDGGVVANNPAMCAYVEACKLFESHARTLVVSLGTGDLTHTHRLSQVDRWGEIEWAEPILNILFDASGSIVHEQLQTVLDSDLTHPMYFRFQGTLSTAEQSMDDASAANLHALQNLAMEIIRSESSSLDQVCELLVGAADSAPARPERSQPR